MPRLTLRRKLVLFTAVIAVVPLLIAGQTLIRIARDELKSSANEQLVTTARQISDEIDDVFEFVWVGPLLLIGNALDDPQLAVQDKISLLTRGIADLSDVVALQITVEGSKLPLVISRDSYSTRLAGARVEPISVIRTPVETVAEIVAAGSGRMRVEQVAATGEWLGTLVFPLESQFGGGRAALSARIDLSRLQRFIADHPFRRAGEIRIVDSTGRTVLTDTPEDLNDQAIVVQALSLLAPGQQVVSSETYTRPDGTEMLAAYAFPRPVDWAVIVEKSEHDAYFAIGRMIRSLGLWVSVGLVAAIAGAVVLAIGISRPILAIGEAVSEVAGGNFRARVRGHRPRDEIGDLAQRIDTMIIQLNERFHLAKFVSGGTMAAIQRSDHDGVRLGGERREAAILFADIRGYTSFAETRDPETVVEVLNYYFQRQADVVTAHRGDIDKFVGDQIMAVFQGEEMAYHAARCAIEIQAVMRELGREHPDWELGIGIGIDAGEVVMGAMGSKERMDYTVLGDHVNLAARLCSAATPGQTLVSERIREPIAGRPDVHLEELSPIRVKGKSAAIAVHALTGHAPAGGAVASADALAGAARP